MYLTPNYNKILALIQYNTSVSELRAKIIIKVDLGA